LQVKEIIDFQYEVVAKIINELKEVLEERAKLLLKEENSEGDRLKSMLAAHKKVT